MAESLIIIWEKDKISLKLIESAGVWSDDLPAIKNVEISRPSRLSRITQYIHQRETAASISELLENTDINQPLWLLIPEKWTSRIEIDSPEFSSEELRQDHIEWEATQRLSGDIEKYNIKIVEQDSSETVDIRVIRTDLLAALEEIPRSIDLTIAGISTIPADGESYLFETLHDLRESRRFEADDTSLVVPHRSSINPIAAVVIVAVIAIAGWFWSRGSNDDSEAKIKMATSAMDKEKSVAAISGTPSPMVQPKAELMDKQEAALTEMSHGKSKSKAESSAKLATPKAQPVTKTVGSPLGTLQRSLPKGATIELAVISPMDMRIEVSGQINADSWIKSFKKSSGLKQVSSPRYYTESGKRLTIIQVKNPGLVASKGSRSIRNWRSKATSAGLSVKGRNATGSSKNAFAFAESLWKDMHGFSKIYLAHDRNDWVITIQ